MAVDKSKAKRLAGGKFAPGSPAISPGRPKGSRHRLSESFLKALADDFDEHGIAAIERVRAEDPATYIRVAASLIEKVVDVTSGGAPMVAFVLPAQITDSQAWAEAARKQIEGPTE